MKKPVCERKTNAGRRFGVDIDDAPNAASIADEMGSEEVDQMSVGLRFAARPQKGGVAKDEPWRYLARLQKRLRPVKIFCHEVVEHGALHETMLQLRPFGGGNQNWKKIDRPRLPAAGL